MERTPPLRPPFVGGLGERREKLGEENRRVSHLRDSHTKQANGWNGIVLRSEVRNLPSTPSTPLFEHFIVIITPSPKPLAHMELAKKGARVHTLKQRAEEEEWAKSLTTPQTAYPLFLAISSSFSRVFQYTK